MNLSNVSLKVSNYKSFGEKQGLDRIAPINIIIGRNNSGKSALLDLVDFAVEPRDISPFGHNGETPCVYLTVPLSDWTIRKVFPENTSGGPIQGNHYEYGKRLVDMPITVELGQTGKTVFSYLEKEVHEQFRQELGRIIDNPFKGAGFKRILAERDIQPETESEVTLNSAGRGATNLIRYFLHDARADQRVVEVELLQYLNEIFSPDTEFSRIQAKLLPNANRWEIYLQEESKGNIALSNSGSGLKTVIQVLAQTLLIPKIEQRGMSSYIFAFEELENNLHPGLQRRLFSYLRKLAVTEGATFFITTHSNVVIDLFGGDAQAQLLHVTHNRQEARVNALTEYIDNTGVLDDLDVRASDILQSNGVIWVEGPSDRVYINRLIELATGGKLREGAHYQCVFYGGRLLARITANPDDNEPVNLLRINRHCCLVMDSDKRTAEAQLNSTKLRLCEEVDGVGGYAWVTDGKEIENSIPTEALKQLFSRDDLGDIGVYQNFDEYLDENIGEGEGKKFLQNKVLFAEQIVPQIDKDMLDGAPQLKAHIKQICNQISRWNSMELTFD